MKILRKTYCFKLKNLKRLISGAQKAKILTRTKLGEPFIARSTYRLLSMLLFLANYT